MSLFKSVTKVISGAFALVLLGCYGTASARFVSVDPAAFTENNPQTFNRYEYGNDNPYRYIDPDGRQAKDPLNPGGAAMQPVLGPPMGPGYIRAPISAAGEQLQANRAAGEAFEQKAARELTNTQTGIVKQVTIETTNGTRTRVDLMGRDASGSIRCTECKASQTAPLTKNQKAAFPEIEKNGGTVVGNGKPGFPGGTVIPPTKVDIVRP